MFLRDSLTKHIGIMFIASMLANVANYFFHIFMSRALGPGDYGILASLSSLFLILSVPIGTIQTTVAKYTSHFKALGNYIRISQLFSISLRKLFLIGIVSFLIFIGFSKYIASFLQTPSLLPIIIIGTCLPVSFILPLIWGELQGLQEFNYLGSNIVLQAFSKLALGISLVYLGWRVNGALLGYVLSPLIAFSFAIIYLLHIFQRQKNAENSQETFQDSKHFQKLDSTIEYSSKDSFPKEILNFSEKQKGLPNIFIYSLPVALTILCFTLLTNGDVLLVKHFFVPYQAGYYSAASIVAKIIIYLPGAIGIVMFPKTSELHALNQDSLGVLKKSLLYTVIICGGILGIYFLFPSYIISILFGKQYTFIIPLIGIFGLAMFFFALSNILFMYQLSLNQTKFVFSLIAAVLLEIILIAFFHQTLTQVIWILLVIGAILFLINILFVFWNYRGFPSNLRKKSTG